MLSSGFGDSVHVQVLRFELGLGRHFEFGVVFGMDLGLGFGVRLDQKV